MKRIHGIATISILSLLGLALAGCSGTHAQPAYIYMPEMVYSPAIKAQEEGSMMMPVKGTVSRGHSPYKWGVFEGDEAAKVLRNPIPPTQAAAQRGKVMFETYCTPCHGAGGEGDGTIVPKFPRPPTLLSDKIRMWNDGRIYHVITMGQNLMPSYASQILPADRWAIVHYMRALSRAKSP